MKTVMQFAVLALAVSLGACGGGGDGGTSASSGTAEGFWQGPTSTGFNASVVVLENGETWGFYTSGNLLVGALYGQTQSAGSTVSGSGSDFNIPSRTVTASSYSGTVSPKSSISIRTAAGTTFNGAYSSAYDQPALLSNVAGTFAGFGVTGRTSGQSISATISSSGAITVPTTNGCGAAGTATPRSSGKNIFNVTVTFAGSSCALGNGTVTTGVAYYDVGSRQVLVLAMNPAKTDGFIYVGSK